MSGGGYAQAPNAQKQDSAAVPKQESAGAPKQEQQPSAPVQNRQLVQTARIQMTVPDPVAAVPILFFITVAADPAAVVPFFFPILRQRRDRRK